MNQDLEDKIGDLALFGVILTKNILAFWLRGAVPDFLQSAAQKKSSVVDIQKFR